MSENEPEQEEIAGIDPVDPLKRDADDDDERMPGWDPVVPSIPPEE